MINAFFNQYGRQKAAFIHEKELSQFSITNIKKLAKHENSTDLLRNRILRTFLKRDSKTHDKQLYKFTIDEFRHYLKINDAILPSIITQNDNGDYVLFFKTDNESLAFSEGMHSSFINLLTFYKNKKKHFTMEWK